MNVSPNDTTSNKNYYILGVDEVAKKYWFVRTDQKPKIENYALSTLTKIETILRELKAFKKEWVDIEPKEWWDDELLDNAEGIYKQHESEMPFLAIRSYYMKDLDKVYGRIQNLINLPESFPLIPDIIQKTLDLLTPKELTVFSQLNHTAKNQVDSHYINCAKKTGYVSCKVAIKARLHLKALNKGIKNFCTEKLLEIKDISYSEKGEIDSKKTLENIKHLTTEDLFTIFSKNATYDKTHMLVRRFIYTQEGLRQKNNEILSKAIAKKGVDAIWASVNNLNNVSTRLLLNRGASSNVYGPYTPLKIRADLVTVASINGNTTLVELLLKNGAKIANPASNGSLAIHFAAENGHMKIVQIFLKYDLINTPCRIGGTALSFACRQNREDLVRFLLKNGADIRKGFCLLQAVDKNLHNIVEILLENHADVNELDENNRTLLQVAVIKKASNKIIKLLLENEAWIDAIDADSNTALHLALINGSPSSKLLIENGANVNCLNKKGETPLMLAVKKHDMDAVKLLIEKNAKVNIVDQAGQTPLHWAVERRFNNIIELLLKKKANPNAVDNEGNTPLHLAIIKTSDACQLLIDKGADVNSVNINGHTPLCLAVNKLSFGIVKLLLENKADVHFQDKNGTTSVHFAVAKGNVEILQLLVENGGDVNFVTPHGVTMLHSNITHSFKIAKFLVGQGVNVNSVTSEGNTVLHNMMIKNARNDELIFFFLENGADINQVNHSNESPLELACKTHDWKLVNYLIDSKKALAFEENKSDLINNNANVK